MILSLRDPEPRCPSTQIYHEDSYVAEVYTWTVLGVVVFAARYTVRLRILPCRKLQGDDWMGAAVLLFFIGLTVVKLTVYYSGANSDYTEEGIGRLSECQIERITFASKLQVSAWYFYACFLWGLKAMVLFLFSRLSLSPHQRRLLQIFAIISILTWCAVILVISFGCRPFSSNWGTIPYPPFQCTGRTQNFYTAAVLNIVTDALILSIALPMLWNLRVPLRRKIGLTLVLCSGIFVITAAVVAVLMSVLNPDSTLNTNRWATREEIAGILAVNAPIVKPIFYRNFWTRDFPAVSPRRSRRAPARPANADPRLMMMETPRLVTVGRLGVLSSMPSGYSTTSLSKTGSRSKSGQSGSSSGQGADCVEIVELEEGNWGREGGDGHGGTLSHALAREGPGPLLPEPTHNKWSSSRPGSLPGPGLQSIGEEGNVETAERSGKI